MYTRVTRGRVDTRGHAWARVGTRAHAWAPQMCSRKWSLVDVPGKETWAPTETWALRAVERATAQHSQTCALYKYIARIDSVSCRS